MILLGAGLLILAAGAYLFSVGRYADYTTRSKVTDLVNVAGVCKTSVAEFYQERRRMPAGEAEAQCGALQGTYSSPARVKDGVITVQAAGKLKAELEGFGSGIELRYTPRCTGGSCNGASIEAWDCKTGTTIQPRHLPAMCR